MHFLFAFLLIFTPLYASAQTQYYSFEKPHTQIGFYVSHLGFSYSHGRFMDFDGKIAFDRTDPEKSSVEISILTDSIEMNHTAWNEHMKGKKFFDTSNFPNMVFKSATIEKTSENTANISGDLTILGVTRPVTLETTFNSEGKNPFSGNHIAGFSARTNIKRSDFEMKTYLPSIGDDVEIRIEVEAICEEGCPAPLNE